MQRLYVLFDERCGLCRRAAEWASSQPSYFGLIFVPAGSEQAKRLFPSFTHAGEPEELIAVGDSGEVYRGDSAWIMCLFALKGYREWANRLASPALRPLARQAFALVSKQRQNISRWIGLGDDHEVARKLRSLSAPACEIEPNLGQQKLIASDTLNKSSILNTEERREFQLQGDGNE